MPENTKNYNFVKPQLDDTADITATNDNWDILDDELNDIETNIGNMQTNILSNNNSIIKLKSDSSSLQSGLENKQDEITGAAATITSSDLNANRALVSDTDGKVGVSDVTSTELGYLDGVTSNIQEQLSTKVSKRGDTLDGMLTFNNIDAYHALHKYRTINGTTYGVNVGCGILGGDGVVVLEVRQGNSTNSELLGRLEVGERGVSFVSLVEENEKRTYLTNNGAVIAVVE